LDKFEIDSLKNHNAQLFRERESLRSEIAELRAKVETLENQPPKIVEKIVEVKQPPKIVEKIVEVKQPPKIVEKIVEVENTKRIKAVEKQLQQAKKKLETEKAKPPVTVEKIVKVKDEESLKRLFDLDTIKNHNAQLFRERETMRSEIMELDTKLKALQEQPPKIIEKIVEVEDTKRVKSLQAHLRHIERQLEAEKAKPPKVIKQRVVTPESETVRLLKSKVKELEKQIDVMAQRLNQRADHGSGD